MVYVSSVKKISSSPNSRTVELRFLNRKKINKKLRNVWFQGAELVELKNEVKKMLPEGMVVGSGVLQFRTPLGWRSALWSNVAPSALTSDGDIDDPDMYDKFAVAIFTVTIRKV